MNLTLPKIMIKKYKVEENDLDIMELSKIIHFFNIFI